MQPAVMTTFALFGLMTLTENVFYCMNFRMLKTRSMCHPDHSGKSATGVTFASQKQEASRRKSVMHLWLLPSHPAFSIN